MIAPLARILDTFVANHANLLRDDVQLLADFDTDPDEHRTILRAHQLVRRQLISNHLARQRRVERLATAFLPFVRGYLNPGPVFLRGLRRRRRGKLLRFIQEQVALTGIARLLAARAEQLAHHDLQLFLHEVAFGLRHPKLAAKLVAFITQRITRSECCITFSNERVEFVDGDREAFARHAATLANRPPQWVNVNL
ncbi:hypothetical protein R69658_08203 [Paraburkholderia aspalathi]|uniref:Uncharacterized protein n=1 Tax=Paraburkholderia aspalathi TaxID=1324617 RepID=A0ABN7NCE2_9BURK|nr:hypothetical protein R69658_08203 [Paraburkholderia aspalathi]